MYLAGALHDIGKMAIGNEILEKPDCHNIMGVARYRLEYNIEKCCKKKSKNQHSHLDSANKVCYSTNRTKEER